jgi:thiamine pyrophosphate-dependent acetolactate synthase large subunit-like protein
MTAGSPQRSVADAVGEAVGAAGAAHAFGVIGSGNLVVTNALCRAGAQFHHARHEGAAISMADGYARVSGDVGVCSVHQGPGLTNTITGLTEAAKSHTPVLVLAGEAPAAAVTSNFRIAQDDLVTSVGAGVDRVYGPATAVADARRAYRRAIVERRPIVLMLPIDIQAMPAISGPDAPAGAPAPVELPPPAPAANAIATIADTLIAGRLPVILAGRGAVLAQAQERLERLGALIGALLATSAPAKGLFAGLPYAVGISGGFASPFAAELLPRADVVLLFGASANQWTTRHGTLFSDHACVIQVDVEPGAIGAHRPVNLALVADAGLAADALSDELERRGHRATGFRTAELADEIAANDWANDPYEELSTGDWIDPRTLSLELERRLPADKLVVTDSGHSLGYPAMFLSVPDARSWVFPNGFQAVGLGLGSAIGAAIARPEVPTVAALGDGGTFMALAEIETAVRLGLKLLVCIYDDSAYGAEVHHFAPLGHDVGLVRFPDADLAAIARAAGAQAATVRTAADLDVVGPWLATPAPGPLVLDAKVNPTVCAEWLAEAFRSG